MRAPPLADPAFLFLPARGHNGGTRIITSEGSLSFLWNLSLRGKGQTISLGFDSCVLREKSQPSHLFSGYKWHAYLLFFVSSALMAGNNGSQGGFVPQSASVSCLLLSGGSIWGQLKRGISEVVRIWGVLFTGKCTVTWEIIEEIICLCHQQMPLHSKCWGVFE